jgi:polar amino acid transport system permease protein
LAVVADWERLQRKFFNVEIAAVMFPEVITIAAKNTVVYTAWPSRFGLLFGLMLALMRLSPIAAVPLGGAHLHRDLPRTAGPADDLPVRPRHPDRVQLATRGRIRLQHDRADRRRRAYMAETIRAGIEAVPKGQIEAARSLGMSPTWAMASIVLPQAFRIVIPPLTNELVLLIKDTSLLAVLGATPEPELLGSAAGQTGRVQQRDTADRRGAIYADHDPADPARGGARAPQPPFTLSDPSTGPVRSQP